MAPVNSKEIHTHLFFQSRPCLVVHCGHNLLYEWRQWFLLQPGHGDWSGCLFASDEFIGLAPFPWGIETSTKLVGATSSESPPFSQAVGELQRECNYMSPSKVVIIVTPPHHPIAIKLRVERLPRRSSRELWKSLSEDFLDDGLVLLAGFLAESGQSVAERLEKDHVDRRAGRDGQRPVY